MDKDIEELIDALKEKYVYMHIFDETVKELYEEKVKEYESYISKLYMQDARNRIDNDNKLIETFAMYSVPFQVSWTQPFLATRKKINDKETERHE